MRQRAYFLILTLALAAFAWPAFAAPREQNADIAAVVGGDVISNYDVDNRVKFIIVTAKLSDTPDVKQRIRPQIIRSLIDEKLELQEATKNDIKVTDDDISKAIMGIEAERGMPPGEIDHILEANNIPKATFTQQIHAQLAWNKLLTKKIKPQIKVSEEEITLASRKMALQPAPGKSVSPQEAKIAVLTLPVDKPAREAEMRKLSDKLVKEIRGGASFEEISRQFSSGGGNGGKVEAFWVNARQLDPHVANAIGAAGKNSVTEPVRTNEGYVIVKVYDMRATPGAEQKSEPQSPPTDTQVTLKEILLKLKPDAQDREAHVLLEIGEEVAKHPGTCQEKGVAGLDNLDAVDIETNMRQSFMSDLPQALRTIAESLKVGDVSIPFATDEGLRLYMLCERTEAVLKTPDHEQAYRMLMQQKMDLETQKYLRNLRREAFIEIR